MEFIQITKESELNEILERSGNKPQLIFKFSSRCSLSDTILHRLDKEPNPPNMDCYILDLIRYRKISDKIADDLQVRHESPQVLVIRNGDCIYHKSHYNIAIEEINAADRLNQGI